MLSLILLACIAVATASPTPSINFLGDAAFLASSNRIVGGEDATYGEFPWQVTLKRTSGSHFCGGSLITANHVMTAAHCYVSETRVGLGAYDYRYTEQTINMATFNAHPSYNANTFDYDFAIITLASPATLHGNTNTIKLVEAGKEYSGIGSISGWGYDTRFVFTTPPILNKAVVPLVSSSECQSFWGSVIEITNQIQCVGGDGLVSMCAGDSGGPLTVEDNGETILIGAASWSETTCDPNFPAGYAKLSAVRSWIDGIIN